jgi:hypothetical protein
MPVTWQINDGVLIVAAVGGYLTSELQGAVHEAVHDSRLGPETPVLLDARSSLTYLSPQEIQARIEWFATLRRSGAFPYIAFLVPASAYRARIQEMAAAAFRRIGIETQTFTDQEEALRWLRSQASPST